MNKRNDPHPKSYLEFSKKVFLATLVSALTLFGLYVFYKSSTLFLSALVGVGIATLISPLITTIEKKLKLPRYVSALFLIFAIFSVFAILFLVAGSIIVEQFATFQENLPKILERWKDYWGEWTAAYPQLKGLISTPPSAGSIADSILASLAMTLSGAATAGTGITLAAVVALFTSINSKKYQTLTKELAPSQGRTLFLKRMKLCRKTLQKWFSVQLIDMGIIGLLTTLALWIAGIKYWALFGVMTGVFCIIPFVGILLVVVLSTCVIAALQPDKLLWLWGIFFITQQIEGNIILPKLMKDHVQIPAAPLVFFLILSGTWFGLLGVLITPPLMAIAIAQYNFEEV